MWWGRKEGMGCGGGCSDEGLSHRSKAFLLTLFKYEYIKKKIIGERFFLEFSCTSVFFVVVILGRTKN